jgi:hypothetical protein
LNARWRTAVRSKIHYEHVPVEVAKKLADAYRRLLQSIAAKKTARRNKVRK